MNIHLPAAAPHAPLCKVCDELPVIPLATIKNSEPECCGRCAIWFFSLYYALHQQSNLREVLIARAWDSLPKEAPCQ